MKKGIKTGFTLIEVCLVMMIFGIAVSSLMALFPISLRQGSMAVSDSVVTTFGDAVMNAVAGRAASSEMQNWNFWKNEKTFKDKVTQGLAVDNTGDPEEGPKLVYGKVETVEDYLGIGKSGGTARGQVTIKYRLDIEPVTDSSGKMKYGHSLYRATLFVTDNEYADIDTGAVFVTYMFYLGEVPR